MSEAGRPHFSIPVGQDVAMATRIGRQCLPLAAALLLTLAACAQPAAVSTGASSPAVPTAVPTRTASPAAAARPTSLARPIGTQPARATDARSTSTGRATNAGPAPAAPITPVTPVTSGAGRAVPPLPSCSAATLPTALHGTLTFAVSNRAGAPWVIGNPAQGNGFEAAVGAAVARQLGFAANQVRWKSAAPGEVQAAQVPGADVGLGEFRTPDQGGGPVDYSTGYFSISNSVVARAGTPAAKVGGLSALSRLRVASLTAPAAGTGRLDSPSSTAYSSTADVLAALRRGAVDVAVVPTPAAVTAGSDIAVVGQLSQPTEQPAQFGMVLAKNSSLTPCVSAAIDELRVTGALTALVQRWVPAANKPLH